MYYKNTSTSKISEPVCMWDSVDMHFRVSIILKYEAIDESKSQIYYQYVPLKYSRFHLPSHVDLIRIQTGTFWMFCTKLL